MATQEDGSTDTLESDFEQRYQLVAPQVTQLWYKRLEPSIIEFGARMAYLPRTGFFHLINGKINPKNLGKVIKN